MSRQLVFIRHAAVQIKPGIPSKEWRLSNNGRSCASRLAPQIASYHPTRLITSSELKASETGEIIANVLGLPCQTAPELHEHDRQGVTFFESREEFVAAVTRFFRYPDKLIFGNETAHQALERFDTAVNHLITQYPTDTLAIVTHGTVLTLFLAHHNQFNPIPFWTNIKLPDFFVVNLPAFDLL